MIRLLVHSRDSRLLPLLGSALHPEFEVRVESDRTRATQLSVAGQADLIVLDFDSNYSGLSDDNLALFDDLQGCGIPIVVMSDDKTRSTALQLMQRSSCDYIRKPPSLVELKIILRRAYDHACLKRELEDTRETAHPLPACDRLVGSGPMVQGVYDLIQRVSNLDAYVLITGESGSGKELVARAIHNLSQRSSAPFVTVSCGAIPETLLEAELFGHEKGAYTGTVGSRKGSFEQAENGTIFLDEIGELSLFAQVKLLRVLQEREFSRLGGNRTIPMTARVLFATHRNLTQMVEEGKFRSDLYFRLNVMQIQVPPLRERTEDIPALANHFLNKFSSEFRRPMEQIHPLAMARLMEYEWPGNVRELENAIARAVIVAEDRSIELKDLPDTLQSEEDVESIDQPIALVNSFEAHLRDYKIKLVNRALLEAKGNKTVAARSLRISRAYLHRLLRGADDPIPPAIDEVDAA
jgi:DNA-binding NtrC family response regulator